MIQDDEYELLMKSPERIKALGFKPQKEILTNYLLPYADELDEESNKFLEQVKTNLAKAVMLREMKPACGVWSSRLMKYVRIYGLKFGKEDHIALIKLAYELTLIPDLEPSKINKFATMFIMLTKKRYLIPPEDLSLPWRPLYEMGKKIFNKNPTHIGMYHYLTSLAGTYLLMVKCARPYFELSATKEILAEFMPQINPWSSDTHLIIQMSVFLPLDLPQKHAAHGHELWFDDIMRLWDTCSNAACGISEPMSLFAGLAKKNPGAIDWTPHVPKMFARFLQVLRLPVSYKDIHIPRKINFDTKYMASWIVWSISPNGVVLKHLRSFLAAVESYLHSANAGRWSHKLRDLLRKLAKEFLNRVRREREKKFQKGWQNQSPQAHRLRDEDITDFVNIVLEPLLQAVYCRSGSSDVMIALQNLAMLRPAIVVPPLLEKLRTSLTSLTEPHRVTAAMSAVAAVARPMLRGPDGGYPEGPTHVVPFLMAVLPGLDPNDIKKTLVSLHFILIFSWMVPLIDCSTAHEYWPDLTEEEMLTCESTAQIEDFVLVFLDRIFIIIESSVLEFVRLDAKDLDAVRSKTDAVMETAISSAATAVLMQTSPKIYNEALRKFKTFATESTFETNVAGNMIGLLLRVFAQVNPEATLAAFVPKLCEELTELLATDEALLEENPPRDLVYRLVLLMYAVQSDGAALLKYVPKIIPILDRALKLRANYALTRACEILNHLFMSLSSVDLKECRSSPNDYGTAPEKWLPIREWGHGCLMKNADFKWHVPSVEEAECAQMLLDRYLKPEIHSLQQWLSGEQSMCREDRLRSFLIMNAVMSCRNFLPLPDEEPVILLESQVPATSIPYNNGVKHSITLDGENVRVALTRLLLDVQARLLADKSDDTRGLEMLIQVWERIIAMKNARGGPGLEVRLRLYEALERAMDGRGGPGNQGSGTALLRMLLADAVCLHEYARVDLICEAGITPTSLKALHALYELSINTYSTVRILAQIRLYWLLSHYPYSYRALIPKIVQLLAEGGEGDEWHARHKGALYIMLGPRTGPLVAKQDWHVVKTLWPTILKAPLSEKPSILRLEQAFSDTLHRHFPTVNTRLTIHQSAVEAAKWFLNEQQMLEPIFAQQLSRAVEMEKAASDRTEKLYIELVEELVDIAETPNLQWRRLELAIQMLTFCPSVQTPYPPRAVRLIMNSLIHDDIDVRRIAQRLAHYALKQRKRKVKKIVVDPYEVAGVPKPTKYTPGYRKDLEWAMFSEDNIPQTDEEWEKPSVRDPIYGFYCWPEKLEVAAPSYEQKFPSDLSPDEMEEGERYIYEFFTNEANVEKLVTFLTVEEKQGKNKFNISRHSLFKILFAQFGEKISDRFIEHALRCASETLEANQRFAAEIASAAIRAPRYWPRERALAMHRSVLQILQKGLTSVTPETLEEWGTGVATGIEKLDPRRCGEFVMGLLQLCAPTTSGDDETDKDTSFIHCARLYALQGALVSLRWRAAPIAAELLKRLEAANFLEHPYQNIREVVGSILNTIFDTELVFPGGEAGGSPRLAEFLKSIQPRLAALYDENGDIVIKSATSISPVQCGPRDDNSTVCPVDLRAPLVGQVGQVAVEVARLSPDTSVVEETPQATEEEETSDAEEISRGDRLDKQLVERLDTALRIVGDAAAPAQRDHARAVSLLTTVLRGCMGVIVRAVSSNTAAQYALVPTACAAAARGPPQPHDELPRAAAGLLASLALAHHSPEDFDAALIMLEELADGRSWWARLACLHFAQPLLFYGLPMLCDQPEHAVRAERFALKLMRDPRLEVRQSAAKLLTGLMHCRALPDEEKTLRRLMRSCRSVELVERHCGVLGLCAYLASRPYSIGSRLGDVLAELARHTSAPDPIPATIRSALADFRRTHQDDWVKHREQLTEDELDLLADLTSPPSYCA